MRKRLGRGGERAARGAAPAGRSTGGPAATAGGGPHSQGNAAVATTRDGRKLFHMRRAGPDSAATAPTVVFEGGLAASRSYWALVQSAVAARATTVVYDRSGLGRSPRDPGARTLGRMAGDLADLLGHLGPGPFLLVGHSWGGPLVRLTAAAAPERIAGVVLADPTDESCDLLLEPSMRRQERIGQLVSSGLAHVGLLAHAYREVLAALPSDAAADMREEGFTVRAMRTRAAELVSVVADLTALRESPPHLADVPVTVISAGRTSVGMNARVRELATASHAHRAARYPRGRHVIGPQADHMMPVTGPDVIAAEILRLIDGAAGAEESG
ncbi:alpha/beta fold hydrolase [Streptomyces uncialis]|uniref:alpha/beta fold hydrolase n=1 Tax=Streptomyces uncialis TaxID=1048205 RepID=UPI0009A1317C